MEGTLRVRLLALRGVALQGRPLTGSVFVTIACDTRSALEHTQQTPTIALSVGDAVLEAGAPTLEFDGSGAAPREARFDFTVRKVPMSGLIRLALCRRTRLGTRAVATASLHLDEIQHQMEGGHDEVHQVAWHAAPGGECVGHVDAKAFWMSTEQERTEMELMAVQARAPSPPGFAAWLSCSPHRPTHRRDC